ncbi:unnamed protein product [Cuscuta epithymum]|uniref:Uncharacterized protein n=1 Tax=Cuscuta epithymum TaxID=186058 RepID=A0AAV0GLV3_9ASTE|nr:unnamed protein product [Cuscuta epithymum]
MLYEQPQVHDKLRPLVNINLLKHFKHFQQLRHEVTSRHKCQRPPPVPQNDVLLHHNREKEGEVKNINNGMVQSFRPLLATFEVTYAGKDKCWTNEATKEHVPNQVARFVILEMAVFETQGQQPK